MYQHEISLHPGTNLVASKYSLEIGRNLSVPIYAFGAGGFPTFLCVSIDFLFYYKLILL